MDTYSLDLKEKFDIDNLTIYESEYWIWSLRPHQPTIGSSILSLKRDCTELNKLTLNEFSDLKNIIPVIEKNLKVCFGYKKINYLMLMMVDPQIHYHVIPRYDFEILLLESVWVDNDWPKLPNLSGASLNNKQLYEIKDYIKKNIK